jgi:hypothetical protein
MEDWADNPQFDEKNSIAERKIAMLR